MSDFQQLTFDSKIIFLILCFSHPQARKSSMALTGKHKIVWRVQPLVVVRPTFSYNNSEFVLRHNRQREALVLNSELRKTVE